MGHAIKVLLVLGIIAAVVSVFVFEYDPTGLVLKDKGSAGAASSKPKTRTERFKEMVRAYIQPGVSIYEIEQRFGAAPEKMDNVYKTAFIIGEAKYLQYRFYLGHGISAYVLCETYGGKVADYKEPVSFNKPH